VNDFPSSAEISPKFHAKDSHGADAVAHEIDGEFVVPEGSRVRAWTRVELHKKKLWHRLEDEQVIAADPQDPSLSFVRNYPFRSSSAAAVVVLGRTANGRAEWKLDDGTAYGEWQNLAIDLTAPRMEQAVKGGISGG
jgi:hypothetical protein